MSNLIILGIGLAIVLCISSASTAEKKRKGDLNDSPSGISFLWGVVMFIVAMLLAFLVLE